MFLFYFMVCRRAGRGVASARGGWQLPQCMSVSIDPCISTMPVRSMSQLGGCRPFMRSRSCMTIRLSYPCNAGTEHVRFSPTRRGRRLTGGASTDGSTTVRALRVKRRGSCLECACRRTKSCHGGLLEFHIILVCTRLVSAGRDVDGSATS